MAISKSVDTKKFFKNRIIKKAIIGEISTPNLKLNGIIFLMGYKTGSVTLYRNCTIGLNGSGFTQLITARIKINQ
jgi:hypothetical protein